MRTTHTYVILELSEAAYLEILGKLEKADYGVQFHFNQDSLEHPIIDMHGIAVVPEVTSTKQER